MMQDKKNSAPGTKLEMNYIIFSQCLKVGTYISQPHIYHAHPRPKKIAEKIYIAFTALEIKSNVRATSNNELFMTQKNLSGKPTT